MDIRRGFLLTEQGLRAKQVWRSLDKRQAAHFRLKMFIDVHCHLNYLKNIEEVIEKARKNNVGIIISNGTKPETNQENLLIGKKYSELKIPRESSSLKLATKPEPVRAVRVAMGIYPIDALELSDSEIDKQIEFIRKNKSKIVAIGEVGLDFKESDEKERQINIFEKFIALAKELNKPIIVHSRKAEKECIETLEKMKAEKVVMHCFSGKMKFLERIVSNGWLLSIPGSINYNPYFQDVVRKVPIKNLLCETDSPFLHPERKENNEPANVIFSYKKISELKDLALEEVEDLIEKNYLSLFG
jgi:TatD DNase family protein